MIESSAFMCTEEPYLIHLPDSVTRLLYVVNEGQETVRIGGRTTVEQGVPIGVGMGVCLEGYELENQWYARCDKTSFISLTRIT